MRQLTSVPIVATIPKPSKASSGYRLRPSEDEGVRKIQAFLDSREGDTGVVAIVPTTSSDEGALVGSRLAISSARSGEPVILIDANLHGPGAASILGLKGSPGLLDAVERRAPLDEVVQQRGDTGPFFVPAGPDDGRSYADFPAGSLKAFVHDIEPRSRRVLLIGSRVDTGADGVVVLGAVSGALLVVALGRTTRDAIESSLEAIRMVGKPTLGIVLISNQRA